ncbi:MAG: alkaline phosphatase family protein [Thermodesulfobacteriota bacterium]|nr:alkaline phosphatase family protein [Thermodesulfobacteriota bacterium]
MLDRILEETTVIVMSDHGFGPLHYVVNLNLF